MPLFSLSSLQIASLEIKGRRLDDSALKINPLRASMSQILWVRYLHLLFIPSLFIKWFIPCFYPKIKIFF